MDKWRGITDKVVAKRIFNPHYKATVLDDGRLEIIYNKWKDHLVISREKHKYRVEGYLVDMREDGEVTKESPPLMNMAEVVFFIQRKLQAYNDAARTPQQITWYQKKAAEKRKMGAS